MLFLLPCMLSNLSVAAPQMQPHRAGQAATSAGRPAITVMQSGTLSELLQAVFTSAKVKWSISPGAKNIASHEICTVHVTGVALDTVLDEMLGAARYDRSRLIHAREGNTYYVREPPVTVDLHGATLSEAIRAIYAESNTSFVFWKVIDPPKRVTVSISAMQPELALLKVLDSAGVRGLYVSSWRSGVLVIHPRDEGMDPWDSDKARVTLQFSNIDGADAMDALIWAFHGNYVLNVPLTSQVSLQEFNYGSEPCLEQTLKIANSHATFTMQTAGLSFLLSIMAKGPPVVGPE